MVDFRISFLLFYELRDWSLVLPVIIILPQVGYLNADTALLGLEPRYSPTEGVRANHGPKSFLTVIDTSAKDGRRFCLLILLRIFQMYSGNDFLSYKHFT